MLKFDVFRPRAKLIACNMYNVKVLLQFCVKLFKLTQCPQFFLGSLLTDNFKHVWQCSCSFNRN